MRRRAKSAAAPAPAADYDVVAGYGGASPVRPRRADVVARYDLGVEAYERLWSPVILPAAVSLVPWLGLGDGSVVADVGAGTGVLAGAIRAAAPPARVGRP